MRLALLSVAVGIALVAAPVSAQNDQSVNYGVGPPSPYDSAKPDMDLKFGDAKRDAETQRARHAPAHTLPNPDDFVALDYVNVDRLTGDTVDDPSGTAIGRVADVTEARDGAPTDVSIELNDGGKVRVPATSLRYNPADRTLLADVDGAELKTTATNQTAGATEQKH